LVSEWAQCNELRGEDKFKVERVLIRQSTRILIIQQHRRTLDLDLYRQVGTSRIESVMISHERANLGTKLHPT
jgi:hypothetical protein